MSLVAPRNRQLVGLAVCALLATLAGPAAAQSFGYGVNAADPTDDGSHDHLWRIDLETGSSQIIGPLNVPGTVNSDVEGLALESSNVLYAVDDAIDSLLLVNVGTGVGIPLNGQSDNFRLGLSGQALDQGLAFDCSGRLLMSSATRRTLYRLDKLTGQATLLGQDGSLGAKIAGLAVRGENVYGIGIDGDEGLYAIDAGNGTAQRIGSGFGAQIRLANAGLDFDSAGKLWAIGHIVDAGGQPQPARILSLNVDTGAVTLGASTRTGVKSLAISPTRCGPFGGGPPPPATPTGVPAITPFALIALILGLLGMTARVLRRPSNA